MRQRKAWTALNLKVSVPSLINEYKSVERKKIRYRHIYETGKNQALSLVSATGRQTHFLPFSKGKKYSLTPLAKRLPKTIKLIQRLPGPLFSVRYLISTPSAGLRYHRDLNMNLSYGLVRLHIPLLTEPQARFYVEDQNFHLPTGAVYFVDVGRFHAIENRSKKPRVHLVVDIGWTRELEKLFPASFIRNLKKTQKPSYFPQFSSKVSSKLNSQLAEQPIKIGTYRVDSKVLPESLKLQESNKYTIKKNSEGYYLEDQNEVQFAVSRLNSRWCFCPSLGPGFRFKQSGDGLEVELRGVVQPQNNGKTKFITVKSFAPSTVKNKRNVKINQKRNSRSGKLNEI